MPTLTFPEPAFTFFLSSIKKDSKIISTSMLGQAETFKLDQILKHQKFDFFRESFVWQLRVIKIRNIFN